MADIILRGLGYPFHRDATDFVYADSVEKVKQNVANVLATPKGAFPWRPEFGSDLHRLRHANVSVPNQVAQEYVARALARWVPYVRLIRVSAEKVGATLRLNVTYKVVSGPAALGEPVKQAITIQS